MNNAARLTNVDVLRGFASLAVCWFHLTNTYIDNSLVRLSGHYGWLGVEVFFVISGFVIPYAMLRSNYTFRTDWLKFVVKRSLRIEPPYLISIALMLILWHASAMAPNFNGAPAPAILSAKTLLHLGYLNGVMGYEWLSPVFWTLAIEFQFYLLLSIYFFVLQNSNPFIVLAGNVLLIGASLLFTLDTLVFKYLGIFVMGIAAFQYRTNIFSSQILLLCLMLAACAVAAGLGLTIATIGFLTSIVLAFDVDLGRHKFALWLGEISFSLYLVHVPIGGRVVNLGRRYVESQIGELVLSAVAMMVCLIAAHLFYLTIERPSRRLAAGIKYSRPEVQ